MTEEIDLYKKVAWLYWNDEMQLHFAAAPLKKKGTIIES